MVEAYLKQTPAVHGIIVSESATAHDEVLPLLSQIDPKQITIISDTLYQQIRTLGDSVSVMAVIDIPHRSLPTISGDCLILDGLQVG